MFDIVVLLAGVAERPVLRSLLLGHNPGLTVIAVESRDDLTALSPDQLARARLIAFVTPEIVQRRDESRSAPALRRWNRGAAEALVHLINPQGG